MSSRIIRCMVAYIVLTSVSTLMLGQTRKPTTQKSAKSTAATDQLLQSSGATSNTIPLPVLGGGAPNFIPLWTSRQIIGNSLLSQNGTGLNVSGSMTATSFAGDGAGVINVNALTLQGLAPSNFAQAGTSNTFTGDQTINGNLNLTGNIDGSLGLQGNLSDSLGEEGANVIGGFQGDAAFPSNSVSPGVIGATIGGGGGAISSTSIPSKHKGKLRLRPAGFQVMPGPNMVMANWGTVGGGAQNCTSGIYATVAGGVENCATAYGAFVGGGAGNIASGDPATGGYSLVTGGLENTSSGQYSTIGGGQSSIASGGQSTIAGGAGNKALGGDSTIGGGEANSATGIGATIPGGDFNTAGGEYSFAAGYFATANNDGSFVWSDSTVLAGAPPLTDTAANQFVARASGGFTLYSAVDLSTGVTLASGSGSWSSVSDRNAKENFADVNGESLLTKLASLPILTWNYKAQATSIRHMGPTAQDFRSAFDLGEDDKHISNIDSEGVALAGVQALYKLSQEKNARISELQDALAEKSRQIEDLERRLSRLEQVMEHAQVLATPAVTQ